MNNKKGVEMSMNLIIVAVIALLILVVIIIIFTGSAQKFVKGTSDCQSKGGTAQSTPCGSGFSNYALGGTTNLPYCCIKNSDFLGG